MNINTPSPSMSSSSCLLDQDTVARIALACAGVSGDSTVAIGIETLGGAVAFVAAVHDGEDRAAPLSNLVRQRIRGFATASRVAAVLQLMGRDGVCALTPHHVQWPTQLGALLGIAPLVLFTRGEASVLALPSVALTGTTTPTPDAIHMVIELATGLADKRWVIAAGTGQGIDQLALRAATAMRGATITVASLGLHGVGVGVGVGVADGSVAISELPPTMTVTVRAQRRAKYLLAAIATKSIIIQAGSSCGALRTAEAAHAMNRPVGVVCDPTGSAATEGCDDMAKRHGFALVSTITDADRLH